MSSTAVISGNTRTRILAARSWPVRRMRGPTAPWLRSPPRPVYPARRSTCTSPTGPPCWRRCRNGWRPPRPGPRPTPPAPGQPSPPLWRGWRTRHPRTWPLVRRLGENPGDASRLIACRKLAERFRAEGALSPHLSPAAAADLLFTLTSLAVWKDLVLERGWDADRYRRHVTYLAAGAV